MGAGGRTISVAQKAAHRQIASLSLFQGVSPKVRAALLDKAIVQQVQAGTILFEQGDVPTFQKVVLSGSVQLFGRSSQDREVLIDVVGSSELVMPAAVMTQEPYLMEARIPEATQMLMIEAAALRGAALQDAALAQRMIIALSEQFRRMVRQIKNLKLRSAPERVGCYILALSHGSKNPGLLRLPYEKRLIASELGMTRESFSRALSALQSQGIVVRGDQIEIVDAQKLARACRPDPLIDPAEALHSPGEITARKKA